MHSIFFLDVFQMRLILPYIASFLCSLLWFCFKPFVAHGAKPPTWPLQLSSSTVLQGERLHLPQPHAKWRFSRSQEVRNAPKCSSLKPTEGIPEPTQHSRALLLSVQCIFSTCSISPSYFSSAFLDWEASLTWKGAVRDGSNAHSTPLCAGGSWKGKLLEVESSSFAFCPPSHISDSQGSRYCIGDTGLFHTMLLWGSHGLKWKHTNRPMPLGVLNKY